MLYIHTLGNLTPKLADLEVMQLIRELREKVPYPLTTAKVQEYFVELFISNTDRETIEQGRLLLEPTIAALQEMLQRRDVIHELINIQRAIQILSEVPDALQRNAQYLELMANWQETFLTNSVPIFNSLPTLRSSEEKSVANQKLNELFQTVLRNESFAFNYSDIINEIHTNHVQGLQEGMTKGFLFHITLEEELKKVNYDTLKKRLAPEKVQEMEQLREHIESIAKAVDRAYNVNMRMVQWAVVMYAYVKWLTKG